MLKLPKFYLLATLTSLSTVMIGATPALSGQHNRPSLIITNKPIPHELREKVYSTPFVGPDIRAEDLLAPSKLLVQGKTIAAEKIVKIRDDLSSLQIDLSGTSTHLIDIERTGQGIAAKYYADVGTISTQLQSGSTPGNPRLVRKLTDAQVSLDYLSQNLADLNNLALEIANKASISTFLLKETRAAYKLHGSMESDHVRLAELEDRINNTIVIIDRLQNNVSDDITRTTAYLSSEQNNMRTLSLAVTNGDFYNKSLSNRPFSNVATSGTLEQAYYSVPSQAPSVANPRPLVKIKFNKATVDYQQPVYTALNETLNQYPNARFELVAVQPRSTNAAFQAIESTRARRNAENVLRSLVQMGLEQSRLDLSTAQSEHALTNEVHIYVR
ncbi:MAG: hypothetical protein JKY11_05025 [Alphaproteobacteria bacterium]|nr:hypothetical protein [Alphaproteobacteria bacterium]